jgi:hypothetical protein
MAFVVKSHPWPVISEIYKKIHIANREEFKKYLAFIFNQKLPIQDIMTDICPIADFPDELATYGILSPDDFTDMHKFKRFCLDYMLHEDYLEDNLTIINSVYRYSADRIHRGNTYTDSHGNTFPLYVVLSPTERADRMCCTTVFYPDIPEGKIPYCYGIAPYDTDMDKYQAILRKHAQDTNTTRQSFDYTELKHLMTFEFT